MPNRTNGDAVWNAAMTQSTDFKQAILSGLRKQKAVFAKL